VYVAGPRQKRGGGGGGGRRAWIRSRGYFAVFFLLGVEVYS